MTQLALDDDEIHLWRMPWQAGSELHGALPLLSRYLDVPASDLRIVRGEHGKPSLASPHAALAFSWSHSGTQALLAVARGLEQLGVDLERARPRPRLLELARRFFTSDEAAALATLAEPAQLDAFLDLWTAKEAVLKAHGGGLAYGLHRVEFELGGAMPRPRRFDGELGPAARWQLSRLALEPGFHGHLAWVGAPRRITPHDP